MTGKYRVSIRCNLCGSHEDIPMELTKEGVEVVNLLGRLLAQESDWNQTITVCSATGETPFISGIPFAGFSGLGSLTKDECA